MTSITVSQDYTVAAGDSLLFTDEFAFSIVDAINSHPTPSLTIAGAVSVVATPANTVQSLGVVHGGSGFYEESLVWVKSGGSLSVSSVGGGGRAIAFHAGNTWASDFRNDGTVTVTAADQAIGVNVTEPGSFHFTNSGQLAVSGRTAVAVGMGGGGVFHNSASGVITAVATGSGAQDGAGGVSLYGHTIDFQNEGRITVQDNGADKRSIGVYLEGGAIQFSFVNSGRIEADIAIQIYEQGTAARRTLTNTTTGVLVGDIVTGHSVHYTLNNSGSIIGNVYLSYGDDTYAGSSGAIAGEVHGGAGTNVLAGGSAIETLSYSDASVGVAVNLALTSSQATNFSTDTITGFENLTGSAYGDTLTGDGAANVLMGGDGDDILDGGAGDDTLDGGAGDDRIDGGAGGGVDTVSYANASAGVTVDLTAGTATRGAGNDTLTRITNVTGSSHDDILTSRHGSILRGMGGDDVFHFGDWAADPGPVTTFDGGDGMDVLSFAGAPGPVSATIGSGVSYTPSAWYHDGVLISIEGFIGSGYDDLLTGDAGANTLKGEDGDDRLWGEAGDDILYGGAGDDSLIGGDGNDYLSGGDGVDVLVGLDGDDILIGRASGSETTTNYLNGGAGNDTYFVSTRLTDDLETIEERFVVGGSQLGANDIDTIHSTNQYFYDSKSVGEILYIDNPIAGGAYIIGGLDVANKTFYGSTGTDIIQTYGGNSIVDAGAGADVISFSLLGRDESHRGTNTVVMKAGSGADYVHFFRSGVDHVDLTAFHFGITGQQVLDQAVNVDNPGTADDYSYFYLTNAGGVDNFIVFMGLLSSQLSAGDFIT